MKKVLCIAMTLVFIFSQSTFCFADSEDYQALKKDYDELLEKYNEALERIAELEAGSNNTEATTEVYSGEWGTLKFVEINEDGIVFTLKNTSNLDYNVISEYMVINGTEYTDDFFEGVGGINDDLSVGSERKLLFQVEGLDESSVTISGQFLICEFGTGNNEGLIGFNDIKIK